jgi:DNA-binding NtrC family response regulator
MPGRLELPSTAVGTLVLTRIEEMSVNQQIALFDWMTAAHSSVQVVSVATAPIDHLVRAGRFLEGLHHRLSMVQLNVRGPGPSTGPRFAPATPHARNAPARTA